MSDRTPADDRAILEARAIELAKLPEARRLGEEIEVVRFERAGESYALESRYVHEVFLLGAMAVLPGVPAPVAGAAAWRGGILVLFEPGSGGPSATRGAAVVAVGEARAEFGLLADELGELERIPEAAIGTPGEGVAAGRIGLRGVTREGVLILDGAELVGMHTQRSNR